jgi:hypothetical protein
MAILKTEKETREEDIEMGGRGRGIGTDDEECMGLFQFWC